MRQYKLVALNTKVTMSSSKDLACAEETINELINKGWILQQVVNYPIDLLVGVFYKEG